jgi:hypothetical protein
MSIDHAAVALVEEIVNGLRVRGRRLIPHPRGPGGASLAEIQGTVANRVEVVITGLPEDDGMSGRSHRRKTLRGAVEVRYTRGRTDRRDLERTLLAAAEALGDALGDPNNWKFHRSGVDLILPEQAETDFDGEDDTSGLILRVPFSLRYYPR